MLSSYLVLGFAVGQALGAACPFQQARDLGLLSSEDAAKFDSVKRDHANAESLLKRSHDGRDIVDGLSGAVGSIVNLPFGGGLLGGILQPLTGPLAQLDLPIPQPQGLKKIPGDDPDHQFQTPGRTDQRGICPTLNTLANHGYISRDGITTFAEAANAVQIGYGFDYALSVFLSAVGLLAGGDLISGKYSIGGADSRVPNTLGPSLGLGKHGVFEIDGSITREDVYFGNNANFILERWEQYVDTANEYGGLFGRETQAADAGARYDLSRRTNPEFFAGVIWFIVSHAERVFVYEGLPNGTNPGVADYANVAPFFLNETFPENWYRRGDPFTLAFTFEEGGRLFLNNPRELGANEGLGNFVPLGLNITSETPAQIACFAIENFFDLAPGQLQTTIANNLDIFEGFLKGIILPFFNNDGYFDCNISEFVKPSSPAGIAKNGAYAADGSPVNGAYPGIGVITPNY